MRTNILPAMLLLGAGLAGAARAEEPIRIVTTLPHLAAHAREVGGGRVEVAALARGDQDPHFIQPTPSLMVEANRADMYVQVGLDLELWSEHVLDGARNAGIRVGAPGHVFAAVGVPVIERPAIVTRALGDVHPQGNPHVWLDPTGAVLEAGNIAEALKARDPAHADEYAKRFADYKARIERAHFGDELVRLLGAETLTTLARKETLLDFLEKKKYKGQPLSKKVGGWLGRLAPYRGTRFIAYHREWSYFARAYGLEFVSTLEPKPGIAPTPGHLADLEQQAAARAFELILAAPYNNVSIAEGFAGRTGIPVVKLPSDVGGSEEAKDYFSLMDTITGKVAEALAKRGGKR